MPIMQTHIIAENVGICFIDSMVLLDCLDGTGKFERNGRTIFGEHAQK
ncbi:hypothetical protein [Methylosoma difficile]